MWLLYKRYVAYPFFEFRDSLEINEAGLDPTGRDKLQKVAGYDHSSEAFCIPVSTRLPDFNLNLYS